MYETLTEPFNLRDKFFKHSIQNYFGRSRKTGVRNWNVASRGIDTHQAVGVLFGTKI
jgi:hypothetical protein